MYVNSEDGHLYTIRQGHTGVFDINSTGPKAKRLFLRLAIGAAYTPASLGGDGKIYSQNDGRLVVVGNAPPPPID